jgi:TolB-like protein
MDVLVYLADHANELVSRHQLLKSVWSEHVAADELLTGAVSHLRLALQDHHDDPKFIETIPKRGYRLIGEVQLLGDAGSGVAIPSAHRQTMWQKTVWPVGLVIITATLLVMFNVGGLRVLWTGGAIAGPISSIAVLPLDNLSGDPEQEYFTDGMTEALITELGQIKALRVISRTSSKHYKTTDKLLPEIARELGVDALIEGSVLLAGDEVRITLQLVHGPTDRHLWSGNFERDLGDVLALQYEVARKIAAEIQVTLTLQEQSRLADTRSVDSETYTLWLKGNFHLGRATEESFWRALTYYQEAIDRDADYAPAYAGMALTYLALGSWHASESPQDVIGLAKEAAEQALALDPNLATAYLALGEIRAQLYWDWAGAERAFSQGIALNQNDTAGRIQYANFLTAMGRFEESIEIGRRTLELDPLSPNAYDELAFALFFAGRTDEAMELVRQSLEIDPDFPLSQFLPIDIYARQGDFEKALAHTEILSRVQPTLSPNTVGAIGRLYGLAGRQEDARALLSELMERRTQEFIPATAIAYIYLGLGDDDEALHWLELAYEGHDVSLVWLKELWIYDHLRFDPRFQAILDRMNFPEQ